MRELHLFAGAGGGILGGLLLGHQIVGAVEADRYCRSVLAARQEDGTLPSFLIHDDVRTFDGHKWKGKVDVVCGGFPCQPWSIAGKLRKDQDDRSLWPEMARIINEIQPTFVFAENVSVAAFEQPYRDICAMGYQIAPLLKLGAMHVGANHRRNRYWLLAAHPDLSGRTQQRRPIANAPTYKTTQRSGWWRSEPAVGRMAHGMANRVDRLKALGNGQVPAVAAAAFSILMSEILVQNSKHC